MTFYSARGAARYATNIAAALLVTALLGWYWTRGREGRWPQRCRKLSRIAALGAIIAWFPIYLAIPKIPVTVARWPTLHMRDLHRGIASFLEDEARGSSDKPNGDFKPDLAWMHQQLRERSSFRQDLGVDFQTNLFSGQLWHEEDSPGNCTLRQTASGIDYFWYDIDGGENVIPLFRR